MDYYSKSITQVLEELQATTNGLSPVQVASRTRTNGKNILPTSKTQATRLGIFLNQWKSPLLLILLMAGVVSGYVGEIMDMLVILFTAFLNAGIGFVQEDKANNALRKLQAMIQQTAVVIRAEKKVRIPSADIVPGDILFLSPGDTVEADGRLIEEKALEVNEAALTGESLPAKKSLSELPIDTPLADQRNMIFRGTSVISGRAMAVVTAIGKKTQLGQIAELIKDTREEQTPLQEQLQKLARQIMVIVMVIAVGVFALGYIYADNGYSVLQLFQTTIAIAVAAIPEGLAISLTVILAVGMQFILKRKALVRTMMAAETLGSVSVICTDKTGTLTEGEMKVTEIVTTSKRMGAEKFPLLDPRGNTHHDVLLALKIGLLCNDAVIENSRQQKQKKQILGDTTDIALMMAAERVGLIKSHFDIAMPRRAEIPFRSESKYMATMHEIDHEYMVYMKGAPEVILSQVSYCEKDGVAVPMTRATLSRMKKRAEAMASQGLRVLAVAYKTTPMGAIKHPRAITLEESIFVALVGLSDPIRSDIEQTLQIAREAGIRIIMITGDHLATAKAIGRQLGFSPHESAFVEGAEMARWSEEELRKKVADIGIYARVNPEHKIRIVQALQANGDVVAMTGDGVNDAPALKAADIGIAPGSGTDVAKETADLILLNNSFETIIAAIDEGRRMYQNIKKVILFLLIGSVSEVFLIVLSILFKLPLALLPVQILWINIIQETFPTIALAFDPGDGNTMKEGPRKRNSVLFDKQMKILVGVVSFVANSVLFGLYWWHIHTTNDLVRTRSFVFASLAAASLFYIYSIRSLQYPIWRLNPFQNSSLTAAVLLGFLVLFGALYLDPLQTVLQTTALPRADWFIILLFAVFHISSIELIKSLWNRRQIGPVHS